jgi:hypothetical protein
MTDEAILLLVLLAAGAIGGAYALLRSEDW